MQLRARAWKKDILHLEVGDTVMCTAASGRREDLHADLLGTVIARQGRGMNASFTVRRIVGARAWSSPAHSPNVLDVRPTRSGKVRRAAVLPA
jgi:ribosomal protein L19